MIAGAAAWLTAPANPPMWLGAVLMIAGTTATCGCAFWPSPTRHGAAMILRRVLAGLCALVAAIGLGLAAAEMRAANVSAPPFLAREEPVRVEGWVVALEPSVAGPRLRLLVHQLEGADAPPRYVRVSVPRAGMLTPGRAARCRAVLGAPAGVIAPGGYDFARRAYFERLGATGFAFGRCRPIELPAPPAWLDRQRLRLAALRYDLSAAIQAAAPGRGGAIAAAMVAGDRSPIDQSTNTSLQNSGLGHLLSVSGVHMGVVGGIVFAALIWGLSLIGPLALRWPVKKLAAVGALAALALYLVVSGSSVPALRAFVMAGVAFGAILLDRPAISMRGLALAAVIVVLLFPESVIEPGFQMSFAATMALVALFEMLRRAPHETDLPTPGPLIGALQWSARAIGGVICVSLVAGLATDPFAIYHFQRFSIYGLAANLVSAPIMSFLVAPAAAAAAVLAPFGLADAPLQIMASGLDLVAAIGEAFGTRPEAVRALPKPPDAAFLACVAALLWSCLWRGALRWGGLAIFAGSIGLYLSAPRPVVAFDPDLRAVFAQVAEANDVHWTLIAGAGRSNFARDRLGPMLGLAPAEIERLASPENCGADACVWRDRGGGHMALVLTDTGFASACRAGALVLTRRAAPLGYQPNCALAGLIDADDLARHGGGLVYPGGRVERAWPTRVRRLWTPSLTSSDHE